MQAVVLGAGAQATQEQVRWRSSIVRPDRGRISIGPGRILARLRSNSDRTTVRFQPNYGQIPVKLRSDSDRTATGFQSNRDRTMIGFRPNHRQISTGLRSKFDRIVAMITGAIRLDFGHNQMASAPHRVQRSGYSFICRRRQRNRTLITAECRIANGHIQTRCVGDHHYIYIAAISCALSRTTHARCTVPIPLQPRYHRCRPNSD